ncbi:hypothetical protein BGZ73_007731 [Actinomortierella ambigua]|nr:hypothetical protein BGZ73_007731 [Actinomortierella ambigua]
MSSVPPRYRDYEGNGESDDDGGGEKGGIAFRTRYEDDEDDDLMNPRASLLKEDASPPLQWGGMGLQHHAATDQEELSSSRFGIDDIAGGAFAVPSKTREQPQSMFSISSTATLEPLPSSGRSLSKPPSGTVTSISASPPPSTHAVTSVSNSNTGQPKRRKWQSPSKAQADSTAASITNDEEYPALAGPEEASSVSRSLVATETSKEGDSSTTKGMASSSTSASKKFDSPHPSGSSAASSPSAFSLESLSKSRKGIVSGLTSLKNSIMIPSVHQQQQASASPPSTAAVGSAKTRRSLQGAHDAESGSHSMLAQSQSSLLDHVVHPSNDTYAEVLFDSPFLPTRNSDHHRQHTGGRATRSGTVTPRAHDADHGAGSSKRHGGGRWGSSTSIQAKWSHEAGLGVGLPRGYQSLQHSRTQSPWTSPSSSVVLVPPTTAGGHAGGNGDGGPRRSHRSGETNSALQAASQHLAAVEGEFQRLIQWQSQLLLRKAELDKELLSLYSRRNQCELKQSQAAAQEQFEEAEALRLRAHTIAERIATVEPLLAETERRLWALGQKQIELGKGVAQSQLQLIQEMKSWQQQRRTKMKQLQEREEKQQQDEMQRIATERESVEKEWSDIALGVDFLGKNEQELKDRMEEDTKAEQDQLREVLDARGKIKLYMLALLAFEQSEIEELQQRLTQLRTKDVELEEDESRLRQKIHEMTANYDERVNEVRQERAHLDDRISDMNRKVQQLDHAKAEVEVWKQRSQRAQDDIEHEIQSLQEQQIRLTNVHAHFEHEMEAIKALFIEEETFRELKARWAMRASSLVKDLAKHEQLCQTMATKLLDDQKLLRSLEQAIERLEAQIPTLESSKILAVQQRDFKQAAYYAKEISATQEAIQSKRAELEERRKAEDEQEQSKLTQLNKDYEQLKTFAQEEEAKLAKEIEAELKSLSEQLVAKEESMTSIVTQNVASVEGEEKTSAIPAAGATTDAEDTEQNGKAVPATDTLKEKPQLLLFKSLFKEKLSELEMLRELAKVRFGRQEPSARPTNSALMEASTSLKGNESERPAADSKRDHDSSPKDQESDKQQEEIYRIERDIQASIAEEDYERAAELQVQLDNLRGAA